MYQAFFSLKDAPFRLSPDPSFLCLTANHQEALAGLVYSVCTRAGLMVLTGEAGTGKTTLLYALLGLLERRRFLTAVCTNPILTSAELFDFLVQKFAPGCTSTLKNRQLAAIQDTLMRHKQEGRASVLIVDEAHRLSLELLEEIRLLLNLETPREKLLQVIIAGQPELADILRQPELRQFKQRMVCHCKLFPLNPAEVREYIGHRLSHAGLPHQTLFSEDVMQGIYEYSGGLPRLINILCDTTLQIAFGLRSVTITQTVLDEAARDLDLARQMPPVELKTEPTISDSAPIVTANGHAAEALETYGNGHLPVEGRIPLESYSQPKNFKLFGELMEFWK